jgi:hypothetical protein
MINYQCPMTNESAWDENGEGAPDLPELRAPATGAADRLFERL